MTAIASTPTQNAFSVERSKIRPSPLNPRKHFLDEKINSLGLNIRQNGQINPLVVRPWKGGPSKEYPDAEWEIIAGECRWRSTGERPHPEKKGVTMAALTHLAILTCDVSDAIVLALMLSENMQRKDLTPLEELDGFSRLLEQKDGEGAPLYNTAQLAEKIGVSVMYVHHRLSLKKLTAIGRKALFDEKITFWTARTICSVPANIVALVEEEVLNPDKYDFYRDNDNEGPLNAEETLELIHAKFVRELRGAPFDLANPNLVPVSVNEAQERVEGGACADCPWNTANQKSATDAPRKGRGSGEKVFCTNPACYVKKVDVHVAAALVKAQESGARILSDKDSEKALGWNSPFVKVDEKPDHNDRARAVAEGKCPTWRKIVDGETTPEFAVAVDGKGNVTYLVERKLAIAAAKANGTEKFLSIASGRASSLQDDDADAQRKRDLEKAKERSEVSRGIMAALVAAIEEEGLPKEFWESARAMAKRHAGHAGCVYVAKRRGIEQKPDVYKAIEKELKAAKGSKLIAFCIELMLAEDASYCDSPHNGGDTIPQTLRPLLDLFGVDPKKITSATRAAISERKKAKEKPAEKKSAGIGKKDVAAAGKKKKVKYAGDGFYRNHAHTSWDSLTAADKDAVRDFEKAGEDSYHACFEYVIEGGKVVHRRDLPSQSGNAAAVGPGMFGKGPKPALFTSPENLVHFAKLDQMKEAGEAITAQKVMSKLKLPGLQSAGLLIEIWTKSRAEAGPKDDEMEKARALLNSGKVKTVPDLQRALNLGYTPALALFDAWVDERGAAQAKEIEASGAKKIASTKPVRKKAAKVEEVKI